jgi:hypothetical protein
MYVSVAGCAEYESYSLAYNLVNPCDESGLVERCDRFLMVIRPYVPPPDPGPGPVGDSTTEVWCTWESGRGVFRCEGKPVYGEVEDLLCYGSQYGEPIARAVIGKGSLVESGESNTVNLLFGGIDEFIRTTVTDPVGPVGSCSDMHQDGGRFGHTATLLDDGRVLIVGGIRRIGPVMEFLSTAEIYDPKTGIHRLFEGPDGRPLAMNAISGRAFHTATLLSSGNVLITGGMGLIENKIASLRSSEVFDVLTETFPQDFIGITTRARTHHTATLLTETGEVLVAGGAIYSGQSIIAYQDDAEVYDPQSNQWTMIINTMNQPRAFHQATELDPNADRGMVLITGGTNDTGSLNTIEIYSPEAEQFYPNVDVTTAEPRAHHCAVLLENGDVLVAGGTTAQDYTDVDTGVEIYSSSFGGAFGGFRDVRLNLSTARMDHTCTRLDTGDVLVAGGLTANGQATGSGEVVIVDDGPVYSVNTMTDPIDPPRYLHTAAKLLGGFVYISGGIPSHDPEAQAISTNLLFVPPTAE